MKVPIGGSAPTISTLARERPISSTASRRAVSSSSSPSSRRPPGNEISPAWRFRSERRSVKTRPGLSGQPCIGTRTAASVRPWASSRSASTGASSNSLNSDDDLDDSAIHAPRCAGGVGRVLGAEEDDGARDLVDLGQPADRTTGGGRLLGLLPAGEPLHLHDLVEQAALVRPHLGLDRTRADRVDQDSVSRVAIGEEARERELGGL